MELANIYSDFKLNGGLNTANPSRNIGKTQATDIENMTLLRDGGIESSPGYETLTTSSMTGSGSGGTAILRGAANYVSNTTGKSYFMVALDNGTDTRVYAYDIRANNTTELSNSASTNRLTKNLDVDFTVVMDVVYYSCEGESTIYKWSGDTNEPPEVFYATSGIMPFDARHLFSYNNRMGIAGTRDNRSQFVLSAYRDPNHWDTATGNSLGDKAYSNIPDSDTDQYITAVVPDGMGSLTILRQKSVYIVLGQSELDWITQPLTINEGCIAKHTAVKGNNSVYYMSQYGLQVLKGASAAYDANNYDSIKTDTVSADIGDKMAEYSKSQKKEAHAIFYNDTYRLNIGGDVWVFNLLTNSLIGGWENASIENNIGRYLEYNGDLYGIGKTDGKVYKLLTGNDAGGSDYTKSYTTFENDLADPRHLKNITGIRAYGEVAGDYSVYCDVFLDGSDTKTTTIELDFKDITGRAVYVIDQGTATSVAIGSLTDTSKSWVVNEFTGLYLITEDNSEYQIISNTANTIVVDGSPSSGTYAVAPSTECRYTASGDEDEDWASRYALVETKDSAGDRRIDLRAKSVRLKFYTESKDQWFRLSGYEIKYEVLKHESLTAKSE